MQPALRRCARQLLYEYRQIMGKYVRKNFLLSAASYVKSAHKLYNAEEYSSE